MVAKIRSFLIPFVTLSAILGISFTIIAYGRGYRLNINKGDFRSTGLISATSDPIGAQVYVDDILKSATNNSFNINPGWYAVTIAKEGYMSWQKQIRVQGEIVSRADAYLFPTNPSLSPLTTLGIKQPILSPDGTKIAYIIPLDHLENGLAKKAGLWIYELSEGPLGRNRDPIQIAPITPGFDIEKATLRWSPDSTQILLEAGTNARLYELERTDTYEDISPTRTSLVTDWELERQSKELQQLEVFPQPIVDMATTSARILSLSPDETKILYEATTAATIPQVINPPLIGTNPTRERRDLVAGNIYVYDSKEDKNYLILNKSELPVPTPSGFSLLTSFIHWFPTSRHLLLTLGNKIDVMEFDRTNWVTIYAGPFEEQFIAPWSNGSRIVILTNLNPGVSSLPNLYTVNLR